ncbi:2-hydroxyacid dehydrogenase [Celerinatantimonas diazotrophica]|uniref:Lactate dehydrogenase-like 2-hydroxyacid dehydrogenase n=1 Tax=Celerinatantimonas diazotrophica TaxID=412034 RepID=A0A4R1J9D4_9GAMM|nr:2-hydroxyacid dehydrogenase [Celerinatantimonas diazotrophica]TCK46709.1 lactate dehydrogenase-like 2-hydroxyacid dehydrogenase [Celerinatantimonas diazotrophica]CAG9295411.1 Hydroxypyruvate reductase [Celerinatantimonas diazotrophica]
MNVLFGAPADAWGGIFYRYQQALPEFNWQALGQYQLESLKGVDIFIPTMTRVTQELLATADRLKLIQQVGAGLEGVDLAAAKELNIPVANVPTADSGNADSVAELAVFMMLSLVRRFKEIPQAIAEQQLGAPCGQTLLGHTVGLVGFGGLGQAIARCLSGFGMNMVAVKRTADPQLAEQFSLDWCRSMDSLDELLAISDHVVLTLPDSAQTHHLFNEARFKKFKSGAFVINLGRGGLIDTEALVKALHNGQLAGAGLDVFEQEPPDPKSPLFQENVIATPHIGGVTDLSQQGILAAVIANLKRLASDQSVLYRAV